MDPELFTSLEQWFSDEATLLASVATIAVYVLLVVASWKIFSKAGRPGILAIIPIVNLIVLIRIVGYSGWLVLLYLIPIANLIFTIVMAVKLGERFGRGLIFSLLWLWLFPIIGYFVLGFGRSRYTAA